MWIAALSVLVCNLSTSHGHLILFRSSPSENATDEDVFLIDGAYWSDASTKISGGRVAFSKEFPWQVSVGLSGEHHCGGVIIAESWILSAAHCFKYHNEVDRFELTAGTRDLCADDGRRQKRKLARIITHPNYATFGRYDHDIALLKPATPFNFISSRGFVTPVLLPGAEQSIQGEVTVSGWGSTKESSWKPSRLLRRVNVPVVEVSSCKNSLGNEWHDSLGSKIDLNSVLCAGLANGGKDSCWGDSGGPAVRRVEGRVLLMGIVSWGVGCARPEKPGVYTAVPHFVPWIEKVMRTSD